MNAHNHPLATATLILSLAAIIAGCVQKGIAGRAEPARRSRAAAPDDLAYAKTIRWNEVRRNPAGIEVSNMAPATLVESLGTNAWASVPEPLAGGHATVFMPAGPVNGVSEYKVTGAGYLLVACNWDFQGDSSGGWQKDRWTKSDFILAGWRELTLGDLGSPLVKSDGRVQLILIKQVAVGETGRLRCNKSDPPYFIIPR